MKQLNTINANIVICVLVAPLVMPSDLVNDVFFGFGSSFGVVSVGVLSFNGCAPCSIEKRFWKEA